MTRTSPDRISRDFVPQLREHVALVQVGDEAVLFEEGVGTLHRCNATAAAVCESLDGSATIGELARDVAAVFAADPAEVEEDLVALFQGLGAKGLLDGVPAGSDRS